MIQIGDKQVTQVFVGSSPIMAIYKGENLVWSSRSDSCFSNGYWINNAPWINEEPWENY